MPDRDFAAIALQYATSVVAGLIPACKWTVAACLRQLDDIARERTDVFPYRYDADRGARVCAFLELLPHIKGRWSSARITLEPWQIFIQMTLFSWVNHGGTLEGFRRFRTDYEEVPRKNAKSTISAGRGLYMLAPDNEQGAECFSAATTREQARIVWTIAKAMVKKLPLYRTQFGVEALAHAIVQEDTDSFFKSLSADADSMDGHHAHFVSVDELHAHKTRDVWDVMETATGARDQALISTITTAGSNRSGICYEVRTDLTKILNDVLGRHPAVCESRGYKIEGSSASDETFFGIIYTIDGPGRKSLCANEARAEIGGHCTCGGIEPPNATLAEALSVHSDDCYLRADACGAIVVDDRLEINHSGDDWSDPIAWAKANPNLGVSVKLDDIKRLCGKAQRTPSAQPNFLTKRLNVWINADSAWMDMRAWDRAADHTLTIDQFAGEECLVGVDLASVSDIADKVRLFRRLENAKMHYYAFASHYIPEEAVEASDNSQYVGWEESGHLIATDGNVIDQNAIQDDLRADKSTFLVREVAYDPFQATKFATELVGEGFPMVEVTASVANFSAPMKEVEKLVRAGLLHHDGDPVLTWMISNVVSHVDRMDNIFPTKQTANNKIDGAVALIMAMNRAMFADPPAPPSIYETEGVTFI